MMSKWSSKAADHKVVRLRNNQRRHRKKVKDHIADLETRLAETQLQLTQARSRIAELSQKLEQARTQGNSMLLEVHEASKEFPTTRNGAVKPLTRGHSYQSTLVQESRKILGRQHGRFVVQRGKDKTNQQASLAPNQAISSGVWNWNPSPILSAPWASDITGQALTPDYEAFTDSEDRDCRNLPLPEPGKSTTRCRDAYSIITQQNYKALDSSVIRGWLEPGFRGAVSEGDGCRIDTDLLFTLLDFISSS
ncbi:unnamed protein product [Clonostachys solani]|uniref:BZIP domain-containing protein n=1 Tax=Clonostachys solani TaxID=160281 RepID=A0A9N9ZHX1_9HYPO|nr:unnamed protein product [Clonostachys solani]